MALGAPPLAWFCAATWPVLSPPLTREGISASLADARFAMSLDTDLLMRLVDGHRALVTVEQGAKGRFGSIVKHELARRGAFDTGLILRNICLPGRFIEQSIPEEMYEDAGMTDADIAARVRDALKPQSRRVVPLRRV